MTYRITTETYPLSMTNGETHDFNDLDRAIEWALEWHGCHSSYDCEDGRVLLYEDDEAMDGVRANCHNCGSEWDGVRTARVGQFPANAFGLYDTAGNVQEWTADCYHDSYDGAPLDGSAWVRPHCTQRVVRGGGYTSPLDTLRSAKRGQLDQDTRLDNLGFRVVREN